MLNISKAMPCESSASMKAVVMMQSFADYDALRPFRNWPVKLSGCIPSKP
jgi:hypothetical protein